MNSHSLAERINREVNASVKYKTDLEQYSKPEYWVEAGTIGDCEDYAIGLGLGENWQDDDAFWCSEWVAFVLKSIGMDLKYLDDVHRIAPKHNLEWQQTTLNNLNLKDKDYA